MLAPSAFSWRDFLPPFECHHSEFAKNLEKKTVLITGGGGFVGSALAESLTQAGCHRIILLDSAPNVLFETQQRLAHSTTALHFVVGSVCDAPLLSRVFEQYRPEIVYHTAAFKHVPLAEFNPVAAVRDNAIGTWTLAQTILLYNGTKLVLVSTDKAVSPRSIMGASKRIAERVVVSTSTSDCRMNAVRLGNIIGSTGSVIPQFLQQISAGGPLTITHPDATRYFVSLQTAVDAILLASSLDFHGKVLLPSLGDPVRISDLADFLLQNAGTKSIAREFVGLRPGEKLYEELLMPTELVATTVSDRLKVVSTPRIALQDLHAAMERLSTATSKYDLKGVLDTATALVPEYIPGEQLQNRLACKAGAV